MPKSKLATAVALAAALWSAGTAIAAAPRVDPDYEAIARRYRETHGFEALPADPSAVRLALDRAYVGIELGLFDVRYPRAALAEAKRVEDLKQVLAGLVDVQARFASWFDETSDGKTPVPPDIATIRKWISGWKSDAIRKGLGTEGEGRTLAAAAAATEPVLAALAAFTTAVRTGSLAGLELETAPTLLVLAPTRPEFVGFTAFVGSLQDDWKRMLWTPVLPMRNEFHSNELLCLALENPAGDGGDVGISLNDREKTGLLQHVTQYAGDRLMKAWCGAGLDPALHMGAAVDLVIEICGENNSHVFGSGEGNSTPQRIRFVRGGRDGGKLPKRNADARWRIDLGRDWFVKQLRLAQVEGFKMAKEAGSIAPGPLAHFYLDDKNTPGAHEIVSAPFLGGHAATKDVPSNFFADYQEFLRAYRACFVHWLKDERKPKTGRSEALFAALLRSSVTDAAKPFADRVAAIYGTPLTAPDDESPSLEWEFLDWLDRQR